MPFEGTIAWTFDPRCRVLIHTATLPNSISGARSLTAKERPIAKNSSEPLKLKTDQSEEHFDTIVKQIAKAKHAPYDEAVAHAGKGAVVRSRKLLKETKTKR